MPISNQEITELLSKLREKYNEYSQINSVWFDRDAFEERYQMALMKRMNIQAFLLAEIANFEKTKETYDKKKSENEKDNSFSQKIDLIMEENFGKIKKYPKIEFHPDAGLEIMHFYGALSHLALCYMPIFRIINLDDEQKDALLELENAVEFLAIPKGQMESKRIEDHILVLARINVRPIEIEADNNNYLKNGGVFLNELSAYSEKLLELRRDEWTTPLNFSKLFIEGSRKGEIVNIYSGCTSYGAILIIKHYIDEMIDNFRLSAFRK